MLTASQLRLLVASFASVWPDVHFKSIRSIHSVRNVVLEQKIRQGLLEHVRGTLTAVQVEALFKMMSMDKPQELRSRLRSQPEAFRDLSGGPSVGPWNATGGLK